MNVYQALLTIVGSIVGSSATFGFIQFLIQRKDKKEEDKKNDAFDALRKEFQKGIVCIWSGTLSVLPDIDFL